MVTLPSDHAPDALQSRLRSAPKRLAPNPGAVAACRARRPFGIGTDLPLIANNQFSRERRIKADIEVKVIIQGEFLAQLRGSRKDGIGTPSNQQPRSTKKDRVAFSTASACS